MGKRVTHEQRRLRLAARMLKLSAQARKLGLAVDAINIAALRGRQAEQHEGDGSYNAGWMMLESDNAAERLFIAASDLHAAARNAGLREAE